MGNRIPPSDNVVASSQAREWHDAINSERLIQKLWAMVNLKPMAIVWDHIRYNIEKLGKILLMLFALCYKLSRLFTCAMKENTLTAATLRLRGHRGTPEHAKTKTGAIENCAQLQSNLLQGNSRHHSLLNSDGGTKIEWKRYKFLWLPRWLARPDILCFLLRNSEGSDPVFYFPARFESFSFVDL